MKIIISHNNLIALIKECISENAELLRKIMREGYIPDEENKTISYTDKNEDYTDTSLLTNPTYTIKVVDGIPIYSIFQRKEAPNREPGDGNPLLYSLKREKVGGLRLRKMKNRIYSLIGQIIDKFISDKSDRFGTTIVLPSTNDLNTTFSTIVKGKMRRTMIIDDLIDKMTVEEVYETILDSDSEFRKFYGKNFMKALRKFKFYCGQMKNGIFRYHLIPDMEMRKHISHTMSLNPNSLGRYSDAINGKDILLLDDSITNGDSFREAIDIIKNYYSPHSITGLTISSPLYDSSGKNLINFPT